MIYPVHIRSRNGDRVAGSSAALPLSLFQLTHLLQAGVSLNDALLDLESQESMRRMRRVWSDVRASVEEGKAFSEALSIWPKVFDPVAIALIRAGELSGQLAEACESIQQLMQWQATIRSRLITVLIYPCIALTIMFGVIGFLFVSVVPSMRVFLANNESGLAWHSTILLHFSDWLVVYLLPMAFVLMLLVLSMIIFRRFSPLICFSFDRLQLQIPVVGRLVTELSLSRYAKTSSRLYGSGINLEQSMKLSESVIDNIALRLELSRIRNLMLAGTGLGTSIQSARFIPNTFKRLLAAGESSAALEQALLLASVYLEKSAEHSIDRLEKLIGPILLLIIGTNLLWIVISVLAPVYDSAISTVISS